MEMIAIYSNNNIDTNMTYFDLKDSNKYLPLIAYNCDASHKLSNRLPWPYLPQCFRILGP